MVKNIYIKIIFVILVIAISLSLMPMQAVPALAAGMGIVLSSTSVAENASVGTEIGLLSTTDADVGDTHTYSLVNGDGSEDNARNMLSDFNDAGQINNWANEAMTLMVRTGIIVGNNGSITPNATTTRAQMAQVLYSLLK